jgi:predicted ATPase
MVGATLTAFYVPVWMNLALLVECSERAERALNSITHDRSNAPLRMQLCLALSSTLFFTIGPVEKTKSILATTLALAENLDDVDAQLRTLWILWGLQLNVGESNAAHATAEHFSRTALRTGDQGDVLVGHRLMGNVMTFMGNQPEARRCFERVLELYRAPSGRLQQLVIVYDLRLAARLALARVYWLQGLLERATAQAGDCLKDAQVADHKHSICEVLRLAVCPIAIMTGDLDAAESAVTLLHEISANTNSTFWNIMARGLRGELMIRRGEFAAGVNLLRATLAACETTGWTVCYPELLGMLAQGLAGLGQGAEGLDMIERALAHAERGGERWYVSELLRLKGELLLDSGGDRRSAAAESCFREALEVARQQGARFWELRAAVSLARLWRSQGRAGEARDQLASVYNGFTEGFRTPDLRDAKELMDELDGST